MYVHTYIIIIYKFVKFTHEWSLMTITITWATAKLIYFWPKHNHTNSNVLPLFDNKIDVDDYR